MADQPEKNPSRTAADKERSRQQSRPVSGKDAKSGGQKPPSGSKSGTQPKSGSQSKGGSSRPGGKSATGPGRSAQQNAKGRSSGGGPNRGGGKPAPVARRSPAPFIWGAVALVMVFILVIVLVTVTGGGKKAATGSDAQGGYPVNPAPASIVHAVTTIPTSTFDAVGVSANGQTVDPPTLQSGKTPFSYDGKPGFLFYGAEFCPYCAAERWALVASLARFGTFSHLDTTKSNSLDTDPSTATFSFRNVQYTSPYIGFKSIEAADGDRAAFQVPDAQEEAILKAYNVSGFPFVDIDNKYEENSPEYDPAVLSGLSWNDIASNLHDPTNPITQVILASSNYITAEICAVTGGQPASVCHSPGVEAATKALKTSG